MTSRVGINGFGRIGRCALRAALDDHELEFAAVNDVTDANTLSHLLKYDSVHGTLPVKVAADGGSIVVGDRRVQVLCVKDPAQLPWRDLHVDVVIESTGLFTDRSNARKHLEAGAKKVIITAPAKDPDITIVMGVNDKDYDSSKHNIVSNASCTTNCVATVAKVLLDRFGIVQGLMTTIHSYTNDQRILDLPHRDLRRARAATLSMVPTTTGAAVAVSLVLPTLKGKLNGIAIRVPTPNVSLVDLVVELAKDASLEGVNSAFKEAADGELKGYLEYCEEPLVSVDFNGNRSSAIFDAPFTMAIGSRMFKVLAWYDNEMGYSQRVVDLVRLVSQRKQGEARC